MESKASEAEASPGQTKSKFQQVPEKVDTSQEIAVSEQLSSASHKQPQFQLSIEPGEIEQPAAAAETPVDPVGSFRIEDDEEEDDSNAIDVQL